MPGGTGKPAGPAKTALAGLLTWLIPGAGHYLLGHRGLAAVFFVAITLPYLTGLAFGGVKNSINPWSNRWLFLAEMGTGGYTTLFLLLNVNESDFAPQRLADPNYLKTIPPETLARYQRYMAYHPATDVAQIYLATAGLLNVMAILDAMARAQTGGRPTFFRELQPEPASEAP